MKLQCCVLSELDASPLNDGINSILNEHFDILHIALNESPRAIKKHFLNLAQLHLVIVINDELPNSILSLLAMLKKKRHFATAHIGDASINNDKVIDWQQPQTSIEHTQSLQMMLIYLAKAAQNQQNDARVQAAKINLLTQLTQLTRSEISTQHCVEMICDSLSQLCQTEYIGIYDEYLNAQFTLLNEELLIPASPCIQEAINEQKVKVSFSETSPDICALKQLDPTIAGSLTFPILCNDQVVSVIQCYLRQSMLDTITLDTLSLIEQACHQLRIILERLSAQQALEQQHAELTQTLADLHSTKAQLYQTEKLAAIGQLAAGIAHEINNPLAFVASNFQSLMSYVDTMGKVLNEHASFLNSIKTVAAQEIDFSGIETTCEQSNVNFILEDVDDLVADSQEGLDRIREIIDNLLSFSRKDTSEKEEFDVHEGIMSTLKLLRVKLQNGIAITTDFKSRRRLVCKAGLLNQVFLNLIQNAADALTDGSDKRLNGKSEGQSAEIRIKTWDTPTHLHLSFRDNGTGIPEDVINKIFDPFFTTKDVKKGTGLGLSISHSIIEQHQGSITINSTLGEYTEFLISLPFATITQDDLALT